MVRARQEKFEGMEAEEIKEIRKAATAYVDVRDERMELTKKEVEKNRLLLELMKKYGKESLRMDGVKIDVLTGKSKVRVRAIEEDEVGGDNGDGEAYEESEE